MSVWAQQHIENRPGEAQRKPPDPEDTHEFLPSRKPDDDTCAVCGRDFEDWRHPQIFED